MNNKERIPPESERRLIDSIKDYEQKISSENYYFCKEFDQYMVDHWKKRLKKAQKVKIEDEHNPIIYTEFCCEEIIGHKNTFSHHDVRELELIAILSKFPRMESNHLPSIDSTSANELLGKLSV